MGDLVFSYVEDLQHSGASTVVASCVLLLMTNDFFPFLSLRRYTCASLFRVQLCCLGVSVWVGRYGLKSRYVLRIELCRSRFHCHCIDISIAVHIEVGIALDDSISIAISTFLSTAFPLDISITISTGMAIGALLAFNAVFITIPNGS